MVKEDGAQRELLSLFLLGGVGCRFGDGVSQLLFLFSMYEYHLVLRMVEVLRESRVMGAESLHRVASTLLFLLPMRGYIFWIGWTIFLLQSYLASLHLFLPLKKKKIHSSEKKIYI